MLPSLSQTTSGGARRTLVFVAVIATCALALPTLKWATQAHSAGSVVFVAEANAEPKGSRAATKTEHPATPDTNSIGRDVAPAIEYLPRPTKFEEQVLAALEKPVNVEWVDVDLQNCLNYLHDYTELPIWFDKQTLTDEGIALDQPITLNLKQARLESVLNLLLKPLQLTYLPEDDVLVVTTVTKAGEELITRTYPVGDLCSVRDNSDVGGSGEKPAAGQGGGFMSIEDRPQNERRQFPGAPGQLDATDFVAGIDIQVAQGAGGGGGGGMGGGAANGGNPMLPKNYPDFTSLMNVINTSVQPDSWEQLSGPGSVAPHRASSCLVIRQTWAVHRGVLQLLRDLRAAKQLARDAKTAAQVDDAKK